MLGSQWSSSCGPDLMNLSRVSKTRLPLSAGLNLYKLNTILSETRHIRAAAQILQIRPLEREIF